MPKKYILHKNPLSRSSLPTKGTKIFEKTFQTLAKDLNRPPSLRQGRLMMRINDVDHTTEVLNSLDGEVKINFSVDFTELQK
jgi:hypothetical protein